ncbi:MAG TPA: nucleoside hydrolase [bacterium]|nr:nucleoside hydrolase [bacterium]
MRRIIIDTDPAIGVPLRDIDDALAIVLALNSPELKVEGITITHGNVDQKSAFKSTELILKKAGREDVPLMRGACSSRDTARMKKTEASRFIEEAMNRHPREISIVALGPLSNLATAEMNCVGTLSKAKSVVAMGGAIDCLGVIPMLINAEFNFWKDPRAASVLLKSAPDLTLVPLDLTRKVIFGSRQMNRLKNAGSDMADFIYENAKSWFYLMSALTLRGGFMPHDPLAVAYMIKPSLFSVKRETLAVDTNRGAGYGSLKRRPEGDSVNVARDVNKSEFLEFLVDRIAGQ